MGEKNTTDVLFKRDTLENIQRTALKDGQVLWTTDQEYNNKIYNDVKQSDGTIKRTQIGGTIQVDQEFNEESPYPLANKKITNEIKNFIPVYAKELPILTDALLISTTSDNIYLDKAQRVVDGTTISLPEACRQGIRTVEKYSNEYTYVRVVGEDKNSNSAEWLNTYNGTRWFGWNRVLSEKDNFLGYNIDINDVNYSVKILNPKNNMHTALNITKNQITRAEINYDGNAHFSSIWVKDEVGNNYLVIDNETNITAKDISSTTLRTSNANVAGLTATLITTDDLVTNNYILTNKGVSISSQASIVRTDNVLRMSNNIGSMQFQVNSSSPITIYTDDNGYTVIQPDLDVASKMGTTNHRWISVNATQYLTTSDKKEKEHIRYLEDDDNFKEFFMGLKPVEYKWKKNGHRTHLGFYAQDIAKNTKETMGDLAIYQAVHIVNKNGRTIERPFDERVNDEDLKWTLNYSELIAPTIAMVQSQQKEIEKLRREIKGLKK